MKNESGYFIEDGFPVPIKTVEQSGLPNANKQQLKHKVISIEVKSPPPRIVL